MKRLFIGSIVLLCVSTISIGNIYAAALTNIIQNPGFENLGWPPAYWSEWQGASSGKPSDGVAGYISTTVSRTGSQSAVRELYGSGLRWGGYSQDAAVMGGEEVTASGWLMSSSSDKPLRSGAEAYIELKFFDAGNNQLAVYKSSALKNSSSWIKRIITRTAPTAATMARLSFVLNGTKSTSSGKVYFDDAAIEVDRTPPAVTITSPQDQASINVPSVTVTGTVDDATISSINVNGYTSSVSGGLWSTSIALIQGTNTITAVATDKSKNSGIAVSTVYYNVLPAISIISPPRDSTVSAAIIPVVGTVSDPSINTIDLNGNAVSCYEGRWEANLPVAAGSNTITAIAIDGSGNILTDYTTITYDPNSAAGLFNVIYPANGAVFNETPVLVTATLSDPSDLYVNINGKEYLSVNGALVAYVPVSSGDNVLTLRCRDKSGAEDVKSLNVTFDTAAVDFGGVIANSSFDNSGYPQKDWVRWSGKESYPIVTTDGSMSFMSNIFSHSGPRSAGQRLFGGTIRWGGISQEFPVAPGDVVNASGWLASFSSSDPMVGGASAWVEVRYRSNFGNDIEKYSSSSITAATNEWVQLSVSSVAPDGAVTAVFSFAQFGLDGASGTVYFDDAFVQIIPGDYVPPVKTPFNKPQSTGSVRVAGNQLLVNGAQFIIKGVAYQPIPVGYDVGGYDIYGDPNIYDRDLSILRSMGANTVRLYGQWLSTGFLDACYNGGVDPIYVIMGFYIEANQDFADPIVRNQIKSDFQNYVRTYKHHPAVLMWSPGNEVEFANDKWGWDDRDYYSLINELAMAAYEEEGSGYHPVTAALWDIFNIGDKGYHTTDADMDYIDAWGTNIYEGSSFGDMFDDFLYRSKKVFWVAEFGCDAWHTNDKYTDPSIGYLDEASQAALDAALWDEIALRGDACAGGSVFEYSDEWWKDHSGQVAAHGYGGFPYLYKMVAHPDEYSSEEWYGIVAVTKNITGPDTVTPRQAYDVLRSRWTAP